MSELTCFECGYVGDHRTHFDIPKEPGKGLCKDRDSCLRRKGLQKDLNAKADKHEKETL